jgi:hypothetical protein
LEGLAPPPEAASQARLSLDQASQTLASLQIAIEAISKAEQDDGEALDVPGVKDGLLECVDGSCAILDMVDVLKEQLTRVAQQQHPELVVTSPHTSDEQHNTTDAAKALILPIVLPSLIFFGLIIVYLVYRLTMRKKFYHQPYWHSNEEQCRPKHGFKEKLSMFVGLRRYRADVESATQEKNMLFVVGDDESSSDSGSDTEPEKDSRSKLQAEIVGLRQAHTIVSALVGQAARSIRTRGRLSSRSASLSDTSEAPPVYRSRASTVAHASLDSQPEYEGSDMSPFPELDVSSSSRSLRSRGSSVQSRTTDCSSLESSVYAMSRRESCDTDQDGWQDESSMCGVPWA